MTDPLSKWCLAGKQYADPAEHDVQTIVAPAVKLVALPVDGTTFDPPKWVIADKAAFGAVEDASGNSLTSFPFTGLEQHAALTSINALAATTTVWGAY